MFNKITNMFKTAVAYVKAFAAALLNKDVSEVAGTQEFVDGVEAQAVTVNKIVKVAVKVAVVLGSAMLVVNFPMTILLVIEIVAVYRFAHYCARGIVASMTPAAKEEVVA